MQGKQNPVKLVKTLQMIGLVKPIEYVQMISRVYGPKCQEVWTREWFPHVEADMTHLNLANPKALMYYVLHAKHSRAQDEKIMLTNVLGENFSKYKEQSGFA